ncbi:hypothetical protein KLP28_15415 [Nocardioidaceae bacterium]|nr:hypothetical protein KLP28_15415 [Nocardioidaceae bacterium]
MVNLLPPLVPPPPRRADVVFCGVAGVGDHRHRDHYFETPGNAFWELLHTSGFTGRRLAPDEDDLLPGLGLGLTDIPAERTGADGRGRAYAVEELEADLARWQPTWLALSSKTVGGIVARHLGLQAPGLGPTGWDWAGCAVFVLPGSSGANRRHTYDGRPDRLSWWQELHALSR